MQFYIAKDNKRYLDNTSHGSRDFPHKFTFNDLVHDMSFELRMNDIFVSLCDLSTGIIINPYQQGSTRGLTLPPPCKVPG